MNWIKSYIDTGSNGKLWRLAERLNVPIFSVEGVLNLLWKWCAVYYPDGELTGVTAKQLAAAVGWNKSAQKLFDALTDEDTQFIDVKDGCLFVHEWSEHQSNELTTARDVGVGDYEARKAHKRELARVRQQKHRDKKKTEQAAPSKPAEPIEPTESNAPVTQCHAPPSVTPSVTVTPPKPPVTSERDKDLEKERDDDGASRVTDSVTDSVTNSVTNSVTRDVTPSVTQPSTQQEIKPVATSPSVHHAGHDPKYERYEDEFEKYFYQYYPKHKNSNRSAALQIWFELCDRNILPPLDELADTIQQHARSHDWTKDNGRFVPKIDKYLENRNWTTKYVDVDDYKPNAFNNRRGDYYNGESFIIQHGEHFTEDQLKIELAGFRTDFD